MKMTLIPKEHVSKIWNKVSEYLERAVDAQDKKRYDAVDLFEECISGRQILWIVFDDENDNKVMATVTTSSISYPQYSTLSVLFVGGSEFMKYLDLIVDVLSRFSRDNGFTSIEMHGREVWGRVCRKHGFNRAYSVFELDLTENKKMAAE